jgi:hypothetical protein
MSDMNDNHKPLPVHGYTAQTQESVALVNEGKQLEERVLRYLDKIQVMAGAIPEGSGVVRGEVLRALATGRTRIQEGFMWTFRGVFNPQRIPLPEDKS